MGLDRIFRVAAMAGTAGAGIAALILMVLHVLAAEVFVAGAATSGTTALSAQHVLAGMKKDRADRAILGQAVADLVKILTNR